MMQAVPESFDFPSCHSSDGMGSSSSGSSSSSSDPDRRRNVGSSRSTSFDGGASGPWYPPLGLQEVRVPKHQGALGVIEQRYHVNARSSGAGGFGQVYIAEDKHVRGRRVAIKKIMLTNASNRKSFYQEAATLKQLDHPNICRILESYDNGRSGHVVLELCQGGDVFDRLADTGAFSEEVAADVLRQTLGALKYSHANGIAHRDVKPENICYSSRDRADGHVKLIDWGTAFAFREGKMRSSVGSVAYAAPEMYNGSATDYNELCDMWSLGVTAYVLLSGSPPFWGERDKQLEAMRSEKIPMTNAAWSKISPEAGNFVRGLMRADPELRLTAEAALAHPWLSARRAQEPEGHAEARQVFESMRKFDASSTALSKFAVQVARHLDHKSAHTLRQVFERLDPDGNGEIRPADLRRGFAQVFGEGSDEYKHADSIFVHVDLDGSGAVSFTEFCAVALGGEICAKDETLQAAFHDFTADDEVRRAILQAAATASGSRAGEGDAKEHTSALSEWFSRVREAGHRASGAALRLERPVAPIEEAPAPATFYGKFCSMVQGGRRGPRETKRCRPFQVFENVPVFMHMGNGLSFV
mmetsp:Transcript_33763/g.96848  ORF Transcript_33763/g.96848 Transcript_33763/m.96848 type:complete len:585 (+) Transcript_33763:75-1829(+)